MKQYKKILICGFLCIVTAIFLVVLSMGKGDVTKSFHNYNVATSGPYTLYKEMEVTIAGDYLGAKTFVKTSTISSYYTVYYVPVYVKTNSGNSYTYASISEAAYLNYKKGNAYSWAITPLNLDGTAVNTVSDSTMYDTFLEWAKTEGIEINAENQDGLDLFSYGIS